MRIITSQFWPLTLNPMWRITFLMCTWENLCHPISEKNLRWSIDTQCTRPWSISEHRFCFLYFNSKQAFMGMQTKRGRASKKGTVRGGWETCVQEEVEKVMVSERHWKWRLQLTRRRERSNARARRGKSLGGSLLESWEGLKKQGGYHSFFLPSILLPLLLFTINFLLL